MVTLDFIEEKEYITLDDITLDINNTNFRIVQSVWVTQEPEIFILEGLNTSKVNQIIGEGSFTPGIDNLYHFYISEFGEIVLNIQPLYNIQSTQG